MRDVTMRHARRIKAWYAVAAAATLLIVPRAGYAQASPYRGLWVGAAGLTAARTPHFIGSPG